jgi:phosphocarrier protein HPr
VDNRRLRSYTWGMVEKTITLTNPKGIHARPSAMILQTAKNYDSDIHLIKDGEIASAGDIMSIIALGAMHGDRITITCEGQDEEEAMEHMLEIFARRFDDHD